MCLFVRFMSCFLFVIYLVVCETYMISFNCVYPWDVIFIFLYFHLISESLPTIYKHISGFFKILGSKRSVCEESLLR